MKVVVFCAEEDKVNGAAGWARLRAETAELGPGHVTSWCKQIALVTFLIILQSRAGNEPSRCLKFHNHEEGPYFFWLKAPTSTFLFKNIHEDTMYANIQVSTHGKYKQ